MKALLPALLACVAPLAGAPGEDDELERWIGALDAAREPLWTEALDHLSALGPPAARRVLEDFERVDFTARRARAKLLVQIPAPEQCARVLELVDDPDPQVRRLLALLLGSPALAEESASERVQALERLLVEDPNDHVRTKAREALVDCALEEAVQALDRALDRLPPEEARRAAAGFALLPAGRTRLIARLTGSGGLEPGGLSDGVRAALLAGYGRALAEVPGGGDELRERLPLLLGRTHPSGDVRVAAHAALAGFVSRTAELAEVERAERVLARLGEEGWPQVECLSRRLDLAWLRRGDPAAALELARALVRAAQGLEPGNAEAWELRARMMEGAALYALDDHPGAAERFRSLGARLEAGLARRADLFPTPRVKELTQGGGAAHIDRLHLLALVRVWQALLALDAPGGGERARAELRAAHALFLESRVVALRTGATDPGTLDALLESDLSPYDLVLFNDQLGAERRGPALDRALALAEAWGAVAAIEMQGLGDPRAGAAGDDVFGDPERLALLKAMRDAQYGELERLLVIDLENPLLGPGDPETRQNQRSLVRRMRGQLEKAEIEESEALEQAGGRTLVGAELRAIHAQLLEFVTPSMHAHTLAGELRDEGRTREARALCERALETLGTAPLGPGLWSELSSARFELLAGSTLMDEGRPREAEEAYSGAERRLAAIEAQVEERRAAASDPESARQIDGQLRAIREMRGDAFLSLAVNANVRMGDPARALEYFERAYDLNQSPFMRVLRACYRARSGKAEEARTVLRGVVPVPSLYYNIACTHALLGEKELALDYLERDLRENHPTRGALEQRRAWARKDPDLASLRGEPRFERLLGGS